jgi:transglutaminase/protease-like cytokinesis protein 3
MEKLSYSFLNPKEQAAYNVLEETVVNYRNSCDISRFGRGVDISRVLSSVLSDHPEVIYFNRTCQRQFSSLFSKRLSFTGTRSVYENKEREKILAKKLEDAVFEIDKNARSDRDILQGISEYLQRTVTYDEIELNSKFYWFGSQRPDSHNAYGALVNRLAVCDGFSSAFSLIANEFKFRNMMVEGKSIHRGDNNIEHAWNIVEFEGAFYHLDVTWDQSTYTQFNLAPYFYFGMNDDEISIDHEWDYRMTPKCNNNKLSFYVHNNLVAYSEDQIAAIALKEIKLGKKVIRIKVNPGIPVPDDNGEYLANKVITEGLKVMSSINLHFSWNQYTRCFIAEID